MNKKVNLIDQFITHQPTKIYKKKRIVTNLSRITKSKCNHEFALVANKINAQCNAYGTINYFEYFSLFDKLKAYNYLGKYDIHNVYEKIKHSRFVVDLSEYKNDGDRPQFTILEAMANKSVPVIKKQWCGRMQNYKHCLAVEHFTELSEIINSTVDNKELLEEINLNNAKLLETVFNQKICVKKYKRCFDDIE